MIVNVKNVFLNCKSDDCYVIMNGKIVLLDCKKDCNRVDFVP